MMTFSDTFRSAVLVAAASFLATASAFAAGASRTGDILITPEGQKSVALSIAGKSVRYYRLPAAAELNMTVEGSGDLRVLSRLELGGGARGLQGYTLELAEGGKVLKLFDAKTEGSDATVKATNAPAGKSIKVVVRLAPGRHELTFRLKGTSAPGVFLRVLFHPAGTAVGLTPITPLSYERVVTAVVQESLISYFVAGTDQQVKVRLVGPLTLQVDSRLNFDPKMTGDQKYAVAASLDERPLKAFDLLTTRSQDVVYKDWKEEVPGKRQTFSLDVPAGEHVLSFLLKGGAARSVSLRFEIPTESLKNG
jgi:hypothetical protein